MPTLNPPLLQALATGLPPEVGAKVSAALRAQDKHNVDVSAALRNAVVRGDTLQVLTPYTQSAPLTVPDPWVSVSSFANGWVAYSLTGWPPGPQYMKDAAGLVHLRGGMKNGTLLNSAFTLPVGYRPAYSFQYTVKSYNGTSQVYGDLIIGTDGTVLPEAGSNAEFHLDGPGFFCADYSPGVPSCFPFDVYWPKTYAPTLVLAQCLDANASSPSNLCLALPDWTLVSKGQGQFLHIRNLPGLLPGKSYSVTLLAL